MNSAKARQQDKALQQDEALKDGMRTEANAVVPTGAPDGVPSQAVTASDSPASSSLAPIAPTKVAVKERPAASAQMKADLISVIPNLRAFAVSLCGNPDRADDLVQETLVKAWSNLGSFVEGTNLPAWLFTILRNIYYSEYRKRRREVADTDGAIAAKLAAAPAQHGHMDFQDFRTALQRLPVDQREALILIGASGLSYEEAANVCNCAVGTMKSRVNRARNRLSDMLSLQASGEFGNEGEWQAVDPIFLGQRFSRIGGD